MSVVLAATKIVKLSLNEPVVRVLFLFALPAQLGLYSPAIKKVGESVNEIVLHHEPEPPPLSRADSSYHGHSSVLPGPVGETEPVNRIGSGSRSANSSFFPGRSGSVGR